MHIHGSDKWVSLERSWHLVEEATRRREKDLPSTRILIEDFELVGVMGEFVAGYWYGMWPDLNAYMGGDLGFDFPGVDVKATAGGRRKLTDPHLIVDAHKLDCGVRYFCLVYVRPETRGGRVVGYATPDELRRFPNDFGNGPTFAIRGSQLPHLGVPPLA